MRDKTMKKLLLTLPSLAGCMGLYGEVAMTTLPSATIDNTTATGATSVSFNIGAEFASATKRFTLGYEQATAKFANRSASSGASSYRFDFNVFSITDRIRARLGLGAALGDWGGGFAGVDVTYFLTWNIHLHAFGGAAYMSYPFEGANPADGGRVSGSGATFRLAISLGFDIRPDSLLFVPDTSPSEFETLGEQAGCQTRNASGSGISFSVVKCHGDEVMFFDHDGGTAVHCSNMFKTDCRRFLERLADSKQPPQPSTPAPPPAPAPTSPAPDPTATPAPDPTATPAPAPMTPHD